MEDKVDILKTTCRHPFGMGGEILPQGEGTSGGKTIGSEYTEKATEAEKVPC